MQIATITHLLILCKLISIILCNEVNTYSVHSLKATDYMNYTENTSFNTYTNNTSHSNHRNVPSKYSAFLLFRTDQFKIRDPVHFKALHLKTWYIYNSEGIQATEITINYITSFIVSHYVKNNLFYSNYRDVFISTDPKIFVEVLKINVGLIAIVSISNIGVTASQNGDVIIVYLSNTVSSTDIFPNITSLHINPYFHDNTLLLTNSNLEGIIIKYKSNDFSHIDQRPIPYLSTLQSLCSNISNNLDSIFTHSFIILIIFLCYNYRHLFNISSVIIPFILILSCHAKHPDIYKMCATGSAHTGVDGEYKYLKYNSTTNGSIFYNEIKSTYLYPSISQSGEYSYFISSSLGSKLGSNMVNAYCNIGVPESGYVANMDDFFNNWLYYESSFLSDTNFRLMSCNDICVAGHRLGFDGVYKWSYFDLTNNRPIYLCAECGWDGYGMYLFPLIGGDQWRLGSNPNTTYLIMLTLEYRIHQNTKNVKNCFTEVSECFIVFYVARYATCPIYNSLI